MTRHHPCPCGHIRRRGHRAPNGAPTKTAMTATELLEPGRLVDLLARRPDLDGLGMLRVAAAVCEGA